MKKIRGQRTKIVCTIGPASQSPDVLGKLIRSGMDVARLNCSHGTSKDRENVLRNIRRLSKKEGRRVGILLDLQGPKLRLGEIPEDIHVNRGDDIELVPGERLTNSGNGASETVVVPVNYHNLVTDVSRGNLILLDEGLIRLKATAVESARVRARVLVGGIIHSRKGFYLPSSPLSVPALTPKDKDDLSWGLRAGVDMIALSFVCTPADVRQVKKIVKANNRTIPVIAKLERREALNNIDGIIETADAVMVARGDMGVEVPIESVTLHQKRIISQAIKRGKPVITATQMLDSMERNPLPTRAEVSDVTNAIIDGSDAIMLSGETAAGKYPVKALKMMVSICRSAEKFVRGKTAGHHESIAAVDDIAGAVSRAAVIMAEDLGVKAIVTATISGYTARMVARHRPRCPILALSTSFDTAQALTLCWGVRSVVIPLVRSEKELFTLARQEAQTFGLAGKGSSILVTVGLPFEKQMITNTIRVIEISR